MDYKVSTVVKVIGTHALIVGGFSALATVLIDLSKLYGSKR